MVLQSMSWFSGFFRAGYLLNRLATNARLSLGFPRTTSGGITNCRQPSRSAWSSISSALFKSSFAWRDRLRRGSVFKKKKVRFWPGIKMDLIVNVSLLLSDPQSRHVDGYCWDSLLVSLWRHLVQEVVVSLGVLKPKDLERVNWVLAE